MKNQKTKIKGNKIKNIRNSTKDPNKIINVTKADITNNESNNNNQAKQRVKNKEKQERKKSICIWFTNADVLTQEKLRELKEDIKISNQPDIIAVTELKPKRYFRELSEVEYQIEGYAFEHYKLGEKDSSRGIGVYIRKDINYRRLEKEVPGAEEGEAPREMISFSIDLANGEQMRLVVVYRSPHSDEVGNTAINNLFKCMPDSPYSQQVVVGDFNRKDIDWETLTSPLKDDCDFIEAIRDSYLTQHIMCPTRGRGTDEPSILDLLFTSKEEAIEDLHFDSPLGKSDHSVIKFAYRYEAQQLITKTVFDYGNGNYAKMRALLDIDWEEYFAECNSNVSLLWEKFYRKFKDVEKECIPTKKVGVGKRRNSFSLNKECLKKRKKKCRLWKCYIQSKDKNVYHDYCKARNQVRRMTRKAARDQEKRIAALARRNNKLFWKFVNRKTKLRSKIPDLFVDGKPEEKATTDTEKAQVLGKFFSDVFVREPDWVWDFEHEQKPKIKHPLVLKITQEDVKKRLETLNPTKSPGPDHMHPKALKETAAVISKPLEKIYTESLKQGRLPSAWKEASVTAIYKSKGNKHLATNYRPVSLTSIVCKIMEKFIRDSALRFLQSNDILTERQYGFIKGSSTTLQLLTVMDKWTETLERGSMVDVVYFDFQKAFDTVPHRRLIELLYHYQLDATVVSWIGDFLSGRKQHVHVKGVKSSVFDVTSGVPQGSVLGPLLFLIYINSMVGKVENEGLYLFADDLKVFQETAVEKESELLQQNIDRIYDWTQYSLLKLHPKKCKAMRITSGTKKVLNTHYSIADRQIDHVSKIDDLGITLNDRLSFEEHINKKVNKANSLAGMIRRSFVHLDGGMFKSLFVSIVRPHLEYGATLWNPIQKNLINMIENVQRRASKRLPGMANLSYTERLKLLDLPTLEYRRYRGDMIELYKLFNNHYDDSTSESLRRSLKNEPLRQSVRNHQFNIYKVPCQKTVRRSYFKCRTTDQWNNLPHYIVEAPSINSFKNRLDKFWKRDDTCYSTNGNFHETSSSRRVRYRMVEREF